MLNRSVVSDSFRVCFDCSLPGFSVRGDSLSKNTGVGCQALLQGIFPTQGSNPGLPHYRGILYRLSHQGSPRILEWLAYPFSRSSLSGNGTRVSSMAGGFFLPAELLGKPQAKSNCSQLCIYKTSITFPTDVTVSYSTLYLQPLAWYLAQDLCSIKC